MSQSSGGCAGITLLLALIGSALLAIFGIRLPGEGTAVQRLSVFTYNTHLEAVQLDPMVQVIRDANADIVSLQEVTPELNARLKAAFADRYPYSFDTLDSGAYNGQLLLSAYPITETEGWPHPRRLIRIRVDVLGTPVTIYNIHPTSPGSVGMSITPRSEELDFALALVAAETTPVILLGDFNMEAFGADYRKVSAALTDAWAQVGSGPGFTYPDYRYEQARVNARLPTRLPFPVLRLDYVFYSSGLAAVEGRVWSDSGGSDHRPLYVVLALGG
jgi:endonuclease/exonuclease/phosphatase family metal-dependent hydrolase